MFVLGIWWRVSINAHLLTLRSVLFTLTGRTSPVDVMLTGSDAIGSAACQTHRANSFSSDFKILGLYKHISVHTHRFWSRTGLLSPVLFLPRTPRQWRGNHRNSCSRRKIKAQVLSTVLPGFTDFVALKTHPIPHSSQQDSRSSAEISREIFWPLAIHSLSDIASAAPKACGKSKKGNTTERFWSLSWFYYCLLVLSVLPNRTHRTPGLGSVGLWDSCATAAVRQRCLGASCLQCCEL